MKIETLRDLIQKGLSQNQMAEELGCSQTNVRYWLRKHNLQTNTSHRFCMECQGHLSGSRRKFCSAKCLNNYKARNHYKNNMKKPGMTYSIWKKGFERKRKAVLDLGGKCTQCGYEKNLAGLIFHHLDDSIKLFNVDMRAFSNYSREKVDAELKKCVLLCHVCHIELHNPQLEDWKNGRGGGA